MDATERDLLMAVCLHPAEDTPRLMYADFLDGRGEGADAERAAMIRAHVTAHRLDPEKAIVGQEQYASYSPAADRSELWRLLVVVTEFTSDPDRNGLAEPLKNWLRLNCVEWSRGFVSHVTCSAAEWLRVADELVWREGATVACEACDGQRYVCECDPESCETCFCSDNPCAVCDGTGCAPREFKGTEQPITDVTLTTMPMFFDRDDSGRWEDTDSLDWAQNGSLATARANCLDALAARWPGVTFHMPPAVATGSPVDIDAYLASVYATTFATG